MRQTAMSTKNLARTVIEGGRCGRNRWERRRSNALERSWEARASARLLSAVEPEEVVYPRRPKVPREFRDKLGPAQRWLAAQVGRPWNEIRSELAQRFDTRTMAGRHILYAHLLPLVEGRWFCPAEYTVDGAGILYRKPREPRRRKYERPYEPSAEEQTWMAARRVGLRGSAYFWFVQTDSGAFRQSRRLTPADAARFLALPKSYRDQCDALSSANAAGSRT
jgi:hypothetical protein